MNSNKGYFNSVQLTRQFIENWHRKAFAADGEVILLGVSGGADSMVMADLFLQGKIPFAIGHCNFQLRGEESIKDEELVFGWAIANKIRFHRIRFDTLKQCIEWRKGIEETARQLRYAWFNKIAAENNYPKIATAHHANDNVETLLMNLFRGTGIKGLHGIPEMNCNVIRPLLFAQKNDLLAYAVANNVHYREDASNATDHYIRNVVRHHIVPMAQKYFPSVIPNISRSIGRFIQVENLYEQAIDFYKKTLMVQRGKDFYISVSAIKKCNTLETLLYEIFADFNFSSAQTSQIILLLNAQSGHYCLSRTHSVVKHRNWLIITPKVVEASELVVTDNVPCELNIGNGKFIFSLLDNSENIRHKNSSAYIDFRKIAFPLKLRKWQSGDFFYPVGMKMKKKKLSDFFIDCKIPLHKKKNVWLLESEKQIVWIVNMRLDERFKIEANTEKILNVSYLSNSNDSCPPKLDT
jgi:tRNA(Ile)-lysidine synthase